MVSQSNIIAANVIVAVAATIAVALRFASRSLLKKYGSDDWLILAALPLGWGMAICTIIAVDYGLGEHIVAVPLANITPFTQIIWACSMPLIKVSILLLYIRIFGGLKYFRILAYTFGGFTVAWAVMVVFVCAFQCTPAPYQWDKTIEGGHCINSWLFFTIGSSMDVLVDVAILLLPLPAIWQLQLSMFQRLSLLAIFSLGSLTCVFSLIRLVAVIKDKDVPDPTFTLGIVAIWSTAEPCLGIVATCLPTYRPLVNKIFGRNKSFGSTGASKSTSRSHKSSGRFGGSGRGATSNSDQDDDFKLIYDGQKDPVMPRTYAVVSGNNTSNSFEVAGEEIPMNAIKVETRTTGTWSSNV